MTAANNSLNAVLGKTLTEVLDNGAPADVLALGNELWTLRKWVYKNAEPRAYEVSGNKKKALEWVAEQFKGIMPEVNSAEYNFGARVTDAALQCFVHAKNVAGIDKIMEESSKFTYVDSFHDHLIVLAYLKIGATEKAEGVMNHLLNLNAEWATRRAQSNKKLIDSYKDPFYIMVTQNYIIGTPKGLDKSDKTFDMLFDDFAQNTGLQEKLNLGSVVFAKPDVPPPIAYPLVGAELKNGVATYLSAFGGSPGDNEQIRTYLLNNGLLRILVINDKLRQEVYPNIGGAKK